MFCLVLLFNFCFILCLVYVLYFIGYIFLFIYRLVFMFKFFSENLWLFNYVEMFLGVIY